MKVIKKPIVINAFHFDGTWESGLKVVKELDLIGSKHNKIVALVIDKETSIYIDIDGYGLVSKDYWCIYPYRDFRKNYDHVHVIHDSFFKTEFDKVEKKEKENE